MLPTVGDLLGLDVIRRGSPQVVAGSGGLGARVRWVHVLELADAAHLLQGGELVLTTGVALPAEPALLARYAADLAGAGVSALAVELGRRYVGSLPSALVRAAADSGLTLIAFAREVPFVEITEAVHAKIIDAQLDELRASERLHEVFTELSVAGASPDEIVRQAAILAGRPVILADLSHQVLACEPGSADPARLLAGFARRSRALMFLVLPAFLALLEFLVLLVLLVLLALLVLPGGRSTTRPRDGFSPRLARGARTGAA